MCTQTNRTMQAKLESEMRECERRREEVVETEAQASQAVAALTARMEGDKEAAVSSEAAMQVSMSQSLL